MNCYACDRSGARMSFGNFMLCVGCWESVTTETKRLRRQLRQEDRRIRKRWTDRAIRRRSR